jgi:hypothetical protein
MTVQVDIHQERTVEEGPIFRVTTSVTYSSGIDSTVFVHNADTDVYSHVATVWDMAHVPDDKVLAQLNLGGYYRSSTAVQDFDDQEDAIAGATYTESRVGLLVHSYNLMSTVFAGEDDASYVEP